jgi:polar amino acid transport system substrate-binding protein
MGGTKKQWVAGQVPPARYKGYRMNVKKLVVACAVLLLAASACIMPQDEQARRAAWATNTAQAALAATQAPDATQSAGETAPSPTAPAAEASTAEPEASPLPTRPPAAGEELLEQVTNAGVLVVSADAYYPPQSFIDDNGELDGFDVEVAREVARRLGLELELVTPDWDMITAGNWGGRWDLSIGSMTPTEERAQVLWFSDAYYYTPASFAIHTDNTTIQTVDDLVGKTVGLGIATTYEAYLNGELQIMGGEIAYPPPREVKIWQYLTDAEAFLDMELGDGVRLDAVMSAQPTINGAIEEGVPLKFLGDPAFYEPLVFALDQARGPSNQMLARLNQVIADMRGDGTLSALSMKWYGLDLSLLPADLQ